MQPRARFSLLVVIIVAVASLRGASPTTNAEALGPVDFRYALPWWQTAICLPDDPDKALVGKEGQLLFDYGSGPGGAARRFGTLIQPGLAEGAQWLRQETASARAPIVRTVKEARGVEVIEETFVATSAAKSTPQPLLTRVDGQRRQYEWARPARPCVPGFSGVELTGSGKPLQFHVRVEKGSATVAFGLCEGWHKVAGKRPLVLAVEGGATRTVDPVKDFGPNIPGIYKIAGRDTNADGAITITVTTPDNCEDRNAILNVLWVFAGTAPTDEAIITGQAQSATLAFYEGSHLPERRDVVLVTLKNNTDAATSRQPTMTIRSVDPIFCTNSVVTIGTSTRLLASEPIESCASPDRTNYVVKLAPVKLAPRAERQVAFTIDRHSHAPPASLTAKGACKLRDAALHWWEKADLPFEAVQVPDPGIQAMLESCVRNIWQAREIKRGQPAFHVGPTCYRGLWVVDGSFLLETAALLGRGKDARGGVEYLLSHQKEDGSFEILRRFWKENGIVLWAATRHAMLMQDKDWLRSKWPALQRVVKVIQRMRREASQDPAALNWGLLPPGEVDGGISNQSKSEFSNTEWCLAGLKAAIAAAHWLGDEPSAAEWQKEFDDFYATFRKAAVRDMLKDSFGNEYVPTMINNIDGHVPARGQWGFCHAVYPGQVFPRGDRLVEGQLAMLRATKRQGLVYDTGWMREGIWTYFASFYGHAVLWEGGGHEAAEVLYDFARHASPLRVWREEQKPVGKGYEEVGDMPHNWASAEFIRLATHLIELDRGEELHLLEGFPREWAGPGMITRLNGVRTPFGALKLEVRVAKDGTTARVKIFKLTGSRPTKIILHLDGWTPTGGTMELPVDHDVERIVRLKGGERPVAR